MTGATKEEMFQMVQEAGLIDFYNAILELAAVEFPQPHVETCGAEIQERIRALKINTGD